MPLSTGDKIEIQEVSCRYAHALDNNDNEAFLATWAEDGEWHGGLGVFRGKENLAKLLSTLGSRIVGKRHVMCNFIIDGDGDRATSSCYLLIIEAEQTAGIIATAIYKDELTKIDGTWRFSKRTVKLDPSFRPPA